MKRTVLAIAAVLAVGGLSLICTEHDKLSGIVLLVVGLAPFTLVTSMKDGR